jgi:hypothetical protein
MTDLETLLAEMGEQLGKASMLAVADSDGMLLASWLAAGTRYDPEYFAALAIRLTRALQALSSDSGPVPPASCTIPLVFEDILLTTASGYMAVRKIGKSGCCLLIESPGEIPLGMLRYVEAAFSPRLEACLSGPG